MWMHPMELLDDVCHMESCFGLFRNSVSFGARYVHGLCLLHHSLRNHFGSTCWYFGEGTQVDARLGLFRRTCCYYMKHTICSEINLDTPDGTPR